LLKRIFRLNIREPENFYILQRKIDNNTPALLPGFVPGVQYMAIRGESMPPAFLRRWLVYPTPLALLNLIVGFIK
jgi:hypothetical protein